MKSKKEKTFYAYLRVAFWEIFLEGAIVVFISLKGPCEKFLGNPDVELLKTFQVRSIFFSFKPTLKTKNWEFFENYFRISSILI